MKNAAKVAMGLAVLMFVAALSEAQVSEPTNHSKKTRWFGLRRALPEDVNEETFDIPELMICLAGLLIAGVVASPFFKKVEEVCERTVALNKKQAEERTKLEEVKKLDKEAKEADVALFAEWTALTDGKDGNGTLAGITKEVTTPITKNDALIVIDMQRDFVPRSPHNETGGRFGVAGGGVIVDPICQLIKAASEVGATIIASRDYHPHDHFSFAHAGGHFPSHCVAGTKGAELLPEIAAALEEAMRKLGPDRVCVAFKGVHEYVDSFGALPYGKEYMDSSGGPAKPYGKDRVPKAPQAELKGADGLGFVKFGAVTGISEAPWTGSLVLKVSANISASEKTLDDGRDDTGEYDANAPPDPLALLQDGLQFADVTALQEAQKDGKLQVPKYHREVRTMQQVIADNVCPTSGRIFVCGLALDYCVHDTCVNARGLNMERVHMVVDAARAAHIPGIGQFGSGFLTDPQKVCETMRKLAVDMVRAADLLPAGNMLTTIPPAVGAQAALTFPQALGPLGLGAALRLHITVDGPKEAAAESHIAGSYSLELRGGLQYLKAVENFKNVGIVSPRVPIGNKLTFGGKDAEQATHFCWAYPMQGVCRESLGEVAARVFLSISTSAELRFAAYGGFLLMDGEGKVVKALAVGDDRDTVLKFGAAKPWGSADALKELDSAGRLQVVTLPALRARGAERFCWVGPGERFGSGKESWVPTDVGGFLYLLKPKKTGGDSEAVFFTWVQ